mmetsp:Transcript_22761/g.32528  ORF Transcript_22761/g.32528 Transcript_22761/m.32528 type:complete len:115 (-) Transcript_22761:221-565(-)
MRTPSITSSNGSMLNVDVSRKSISLFFLQSSGRALINFRLVHRSSNLLELCSEKMKLLHILLISVIAFAAQSSASKSGKSTDSPTYSPTPSGKSSKSTTSTKSSKLMRRDLSSS